MTIVQLPPRRKKIEKIPLYLVRETLNEKVLPYIGYKEVLAKEKKSSEIMGCSSLQSIIVGVLFGYFYSKINRKKYYLGTNELGLHVEKGTNLANDMAIFERNKVELTNNYFNIAPKIVIEVDIKVDLDPDDHPREMAYILEKANKMLDFGVEKIIWVMTLEKNIIVFSKSETTTIVNFDTDIYVLDDCTLNLAKLLEEEEIEF